MGHTVQQVLFHLIPFNSFFLPLSPFFFIPPPFSSCSFEYGSGRVLLEKIVDSHSLHTSDWTPSFVIILIIFFLSHSLIFSNLIPFFLSIDLDPISLSLFPHPHPCLVTSSTILLSFRSHLAVILFCLYFSSWYECIAFFPLSLFDPINNDLFIYILLFPPSFHPHFFSLSFEKRMRGVRNIHRKKTERERERYSKGGKKIRGSLTFSCN